jgi:IS30 family transposase
MIQGGMSRREIARRMHCSPSTITRLAQRHFNIDFKTHLLLPIYLTFTHFKNIYENSVAFSLAVSI